MRKYGCLLFFIALTACDPTANLKALSDDQKKELTELGPELTNTALVQSTCTSQEGVGTDSDCSVIGFTPKLCGQYSDYVVVSQVSDENGQIAVGRPTDAYNTLLARIVEYRTRVEQSLNDEGMQGLCDATDAPRGRCKKVGDTNQFKCQLEAAPVFNPGS